MPEDRLLSAVNESESIKKVIKALPIQNQQELKIIILKKYYTQPCLI